MVEQGPHKALAVGSNPARTTIHSGETTPLPAFTFGTCHASIGVSRVVAVNDWTEAASPAYARMFSPAIRPFSIVKWKASVTGLPGKEPETVIATTGFTSPPSTLPGVRRG